MVEPRRPGAGEYPPEVQLPAVLRTGAGTPVLVPAAVTNRAPEPRAMAVSVLGVDPSWLPHPVRTRPLMPGETVTVEVLLSPAVGTVPARYPLAVAVQALDPVSQRATASTTLAELDLVVDAPGQIAISLSPSNVTAVFGRRLQLTVKNSGPAPTVVALEARTPQSTRLRLDSERIEVAAGESRPVSGRVRPARVRLFGPSARHAFTVTARGNGAAQHAEGSLTARALLGPAGTKAAVIVALVAIWVAAAVVFIPKIADKTRKHTTTVAGAQSSAPASPGAGGSPSGSGSGASGSGAGAAGAGGGDAAAAAAARSRLQLNGTVTGDAPSGVSVTMAPTSLVDESVAGATPVGFSASTFSGIGLIAAESLPARSPTTRSRSTTTGADGAWSFAGVKKPGYYLVTFAKPGYQTQRFVIDSTAVIATQPLSVALVPGHGKLSGRVTDPRGAAGGAQITITDGTNTITTSSNSKGDVGAWSVDGLSTPGDYLVSAGKSGFGTESALVHLDASGSAQVNLSLKAGVATVSGTVTSAVGGPLGGVQVSATDGTTTRTASTVTVAGLRGRYTLSELPAPGDYTVTFTADGYLQQTVRLVLTKGESVAKVDVALFPATATVAGSITGDLLDESGKVTGSGPLLGAGLILSSPDETYKTTSGADGGYRFDGVAPGTYVLTAQYAGLTTTYRSVTVPPGSTSVITVAPFHLTKLPDTVNTATIVGFVGDGSNPSNTLCPSHAGSCTINFTLVDSDGTSHPVTPASQPTGRFGPTAYSIASPDNLQPGLFRLTISATVGTDDPSYLPVTVSVQVPLDGVAHAPQVNLYPANKIVGTIGVTGDMSADGPNPPYTNCVYAVPQGHANPDLTKCDSAQADPTSCVTTGRPSIGYATLPTAGLDSAYQINGLCDSSYTVYYVITNPWYVNNLPPASISLARGQTATLPIQVSSYGKLAVSVSRIDPQNNATEPVPAGTTVKAVCTSLAGQTVTEPTITTDGTVNTTYTFGGFQPGTWTCTATATGFNPATTGQFTAGNDRTVSARLVFTAPAGTFVGQVTTSWSGSPTGVQGGSIDVSGIVGYPNGQPETGHVTVTPDAAGCFAIVPDASTSAAGIGACAADPDLAGATAVLPLVYANATIKFTPPAGYQTPAQLTNRPLDPSQLISIAVQPDPVRLVGGSVLTDPAPDPAATDPYAGFALRVTAAPPDAGAQITLKVDPASGQIAWQDSSLPAGQVAPGSYKIAATATGFAPVTFDVKCEPAVDCDLGTLTVRQLGSLVVQVTSDGTNAVADPVVTLLASGGNQTAQPASGGNSVSFAGLTPGGTYAVQVHAAGYQFGQSGGTNPLVTLSCDRGGAAVAIGAGAVTTCVATLTRNGAIAGTVTGVLAAPPATSPSQLMTGVRVTATRCSTTAGGSGADTATYCTALSSTSFSATTSDTARFRITGTSTAQGLDAGYWLLTVAAPGFSPPALPGTAPSGARAGFVVHVVDTSADTAYDPQLYVDPVRVSVTVKDQAGKVVNGLPAGSVTLISGGAVVATAHEVVGTSNPPKSTYVFDTVIPGPYTLEVAADGYLTADQAIPVNLAQPNQSFTISIVAGANLVTGAVTGIQNGDLSSSPLAGATVCLIKSSVTGGTCTADAASGTDGSALRVAATPTAGTFSFNTVPDGKYYLRAERYGYRALDGPDVTYKHTQAASAPATLDLTRVTATVTVTVTASSAGDALTGSSLATLTSAAKTTSIPGNATLSNLSITPGADAHVFTVTATGVPYGCWAFSFTAPNDHYGTLSTPTPAGGDTDLPCAGSQFEVPGTTGAGVAVAYTFSEYQPSLKVTANPTSGDTALTSVELTATDGGSTTYRSAVPFTVAGTATPLGFWVAPGVTVHASVATGQDAWPAGSTTMTSTSPSGTITLTELSASVKVTVTALADGSPVNKATVTLTAPAGLTAPAPADTDASGVVTFTVPYGTGWSASATKGALAGSTSTTFDTGATQAAVTITVS